MKGCQFYRQKVIGQYIVDFYCPKSALVIELDGGQHYGVAGKENDRLRDEALSKMGLKIIRFSDRAVFENIDVVMEVIWGHL